MNEYIIKIGLEVHIQLKTTNKLFCKCKNIYGAKPNTLICPICTGHPGVLPIINYESVIKSIMAGLVCNCKISKFSRFDRKNYFYPDMPKNYQITQYKYPICNDGFISIAGNSIHGDFVKNKNIKLRRIHLEEDVAKINYINDKIGIDYNRAGIPLIEIVSEPDISSADEAYLYLIKLKKLMQNMDIGNCEMEKGQMRCDVNLSLNKILNNGTIDNGTRIEIKNLNSFRAVHRSINYEIKRQKEILNSNHKLKCCTLGWNDSECKTYLMRIKESSDEYRYFTEPDLLPLIISEDEIKKIKDMIVEDLYAKKNRFILEYNLSEYDANVLTSNKAISNYFESTVTKVSNPKLLSNWIITNVLRELNKNKIKIENMVLSSLNLSKLINLIDNNTISNNLAKEIFPKMFKNNSNPEDLMKSMSVSDNIDDVKNIVKIIIKNNKKQVNHFLNGNDSIFQYFIGQVMREIKGGNPKIIIDVLKEELNKLKCEDR